MLLGAAHPHLADYIRVIAADPSCHIAWVSDRSAPRLDALAEMTGAARLGAGDRPGYVAGVMILSETGWHLDDIQRALSFECPIFVEKPLALDPGRAADAIRAAGAAFHCGFFLRTVPAFQALSDALASSAFGPVSVVKIRFSHNGLRDGWLDGHNWLTAPEAGLGGFGDLALHCIDLLHFLGLRVMPGGQARLINVLQRSPVEDYGFALLDMPDGQALIEAGWADGERPMLEFSILGRDGYAYLEDGGLWAKTREDTGPHCLGPVVPDAGDGLKPWLRGLAFEDWSDVVAVEDASRAMQIVQALQAGAVPA